MLLVSPLNLQTESRSIRSPPASRRWPTSQLHCRAQHEIALRNVLKICAVRSLPLHICRRAKPFNFAPARAPVNAPTSDSLLVLSSDQPPLLMNVTLHRASVGTTVPSVALPAISSRIATVDSKYCSGKCDGSRLRQLALNRLGGACAPFPSTSSAWEATRAA